MQVDSHGKRWRPAHVSLKKLAYFLDFTTDFYENSNIYLIQRDKLIRGGVGGFLVCL